MWKTSKEMTTAVHDAYQKLMSGKLDPRTARIGVQLFQTILKNNNQEIEHARQTGRLVKGSNKLYGFRHAKDTESVRVIAGTSKKTITASKKGSSRKGK